MATASVVKVHPTQQPVYAVPHLSQASADETNKLLQENHSKHHIFFEHKIGFHNHIVHHLLSLYALGATPPQLIQNYDRNTNYQIPLIPTQNNDIPNFANVDVFTAAEGKKDSYADFLAFFKNQISTKGWLAVVEEYIFANDARANRMLGKLGAGILHSLIHLGFGVEFEQPAIVAEALAEAAVHPDELGRYYGEIAKRGVVGNGKEGLYNLYKELRANKKIVGATAFESCVPCGEDIFKVAMTDMVDIASRYRVREDELDERMNEVVNVNAFLTASTQLPPHYPKLDFFLIHSHNATVFLPSFRRHLKPTHFARLLEMEVRTDMLNFASLAFNDLSQPRLDHIQAIAPRAGQGKTWEQLFQQANDKDDDGHVVKCLRALKHAEVLAGTQKTYEEPLKKTDVLPTAQVWMKGTISEKNAFGSGFLWTRGAGFERAWQGYPTVEEELEKKGRDL